ncbi:MAG: hypothetical protein LH606_10120 [Cytophagaceae bacterium]|nr:hypothetical protein [Cytophagaceae bacterium]
MTTSRGSQVILAINQEVTLNGKTSTVQENRIGVVSRICQQNGVYLVQTTTSGSGQAMLIRGVSKTACRVAVVTLNGNTLSGPQGQVYYDKLVKGVRFSNYSVPTKPVSTANDIPQTAAPNDYQQTNAPAQNATPVWRRLGQVQLSNQAQDDWSNLNELAKNNPTGRLRVVIHCNEKEFSSYRDRIARVLPAANGRITFENQPFNPTAQVTVSPYAEVFGSGITPPASAK